MANTWFQFKQFNITQGQTAMKVTTDSILLGAWTPCESAKSILDIGTGTGILALMMAQRNNFAIIDAVELDAEAVHQATFNFAQSDWNEQFKLYGTDFKDYCLKCTKAYELIISNPPYFSNSLPSPNVNRSVARHNSFLPFSVLLKGVAKLLAQAGLFTVIIPADQFTVFNFEAAKNQLHLQHIMRIKPTEVKPVNRLLLGYAFAAVNPQQSELIIRNNLNEYTPEFIQLTKEFYLNF